MNKFSFGILFSSFLSFFSIYFYCTVYLFSIYYLILDFNNTYIPFYYNQSTINSNNTLLNDVNTSNFNLDITIDSRYYTSDEFNLNHKYIF